MEDDLIALLRTAPAVTALVPATSINWRRHPQGAALPSIVLRVINDRPEYVVSDTTDFSSARVQIDCWALSYGAAKNVSRAVLARLSGYRAGIFHRVHLMGSRDTHDPEVIGDPAGVQMDFEIDYRTTA